MRFTNSVCDSGIRTVTSGNITVAFRRSQSSSCCRHSSRHIRPGRTTHRHTAWNPCCLITGFSMLKMFSCDVFGAKINSPSTWKRPSPSFDWSEVDPSRHLPWYSILSRSWKTIASGLSVLTFSATQLASSSTLSLEGLQLFIRTWFTLSAIPASSAANLLALLAPTTRIFNPELLLAALSGIEQSWAPANPT